MLQVWRGSSNASLAAKLLLFSVLYGLFMLNYIDLTNGSGDPYYHLWLAGMYFAPFVPVALVDGLDNWELTLSLGLLASLMNDLFYAPMAPFLAQTRLDIGGFYRFQLGLDGNLQGWLFRAGPLSFPVTSSLMAASILGRIFLTAIAAWRWWRTES